MYHRFIEQISEFIFAEDEPEKADIIFIPEIRLIDCRYYLLGFFVQGIETCKYVFF